MLPLFLQAGGLPAHGRGPSNRVRSPPLAVASPPLMAQWPSGVDGVAASPLIMAVTNANVLLCSSRSDGAGLVTARHYPHEGTGPASDSSQPFAIAKQQTSHGCRLGGED